jgi:galactokinase/mevalonate kinase-like predicted kinase
MQTTPNTPLERGQTVHVTAPVRIDLAGGWSDTPPISDKYGGRVVNAAITIEGRQPIQVWARPNGLDNKMVRWHSIDQGIMSTVNVGTGGQVNPTTPGALHAASVDVAGQPLFDAIWYLGTGIDLTTYSGVPTGSGLGASSILGGAILTALACVGGESIDRDELMRRGMELERRFTGGGWQDLAGAIDPGVKLLEAEPGGVPDVVESWRELPYQDRWLLFDTGQRRLAKNILEDVIEDYEPANVEGLMNAATATAKMLDMGIDEMGSQIGVYSHWKSKMAPGSFTDTMADIEASIDGRAVCCGAGGGGFLLAYHRSQGPFGRVPGTRAVDFAIDQAGLRWQINRG